MNNLDEIYNQALEMLKKGHSKQEVLIKFAQFKNELAPLLDIASVFLSMPKNIVPTPLMRRKYAIVPAKRLWLAWLHISKFAGVSVGLMLIISALSVTAYQASISTPGKTLFSLKKGGENFRMVLAANQSQKASLQVAIAQQRLSDALQIFNDPTSNTQQKTAALSELSSQTANAIAQLNTVAVSDPKSADSPPLLNSLDSITRQQKNLLTAIKPDNQITTARSSALVALGNDTAKLSSIKQTIAVARNDKEALAKLSADPNSVAAYGPISQASSSQITVEQITFTINSQTVIKDGAGNNLLPSDLLNGDKVSVAGEKNKELILAQQIFVTSTSTATAEPGVKSAVTQTLNNSAGAATTSALSAVGAKKPAQNSTSTQSDRDNLDAEVKDAGIVTGSFIIETPEPQVAK